MSVIPSASLSLAITTRLRSAGYVFAEDEAQLLITAAVTPDDLAAMVERRVAGLPLEHVLGWAEFRGLRIVVHPGVFVPRRRTEFLVSQAVTLVEDAFAVAGPWPGTNGGQPAAGPRTVVVDLCCGSGAMGAALVAALDPGAGTATAAPTTHGNGVTCPGPARAVALYCADIDPAAVRCARHNVAAAGGRVYHGDLYEPLPATLAGQVNILLANAPYVPTDSVELLPPEARIYEPHLALDGGADGLDVLRRVAVDAPRWLAPGGHLLVETSERQAPQAVGLLDRCGLSARVASCAELNATVVIGTMPGTVPDLEATP